MGSRSVGLHTDRHVLDATCKCNKLGCTQRSFGKSALVRRQVVKQHQVGSRPAAVCRGACTAGLRVHAKKLQPVHKASLQLLAGPCGAAVLGCVCKAGQIWATLTVWLQACTRRCTSTSR